MKTEVYNLKNEVVGEVELPTNVFGVKWNPILVKQILLAQLANSRHPWAHAKDRSEVRGGGKKPWRQKGTGRARHGSTRSPLWAGGGKAHGPHNKRDYSVNVNKKMRQLALVSTISKKFKDGEIKFFDNLKIEEPKTKVLFGTIKNVLGLSKDSKKLDVLMVAESNQNLNRAVRNLVKTKVSNPQSLNVYDLMNHKHIFIEKDAVPTINRHFKLTKKND